MAVLALAVAAGCDSKKEAVMTSGIDLTNLDTTAVQGADFYQYACGGWMKKHPLTNEYSRFGSFDMLAENNREQLKGLIVEIAAGQNAQGTIGQKIGDIYKLAMDSVKLNADGVTPIQADLEKIASVKLAEQRKLPMDELQLQSYAVKVADSCYGYVLDILQVTRPVVKELAKKYRLVLVSNFYGNIQTILKDFGLLDFFDEIIESSVVGVRKPDPAIYRLGVDAMGFAAENVLVVGDSFLKDVVPAKAVGCRVAWLKGEGWGGEVIDESVPDVIITDLAQLLALL